MDKDNKYMVATSCMTYNHALYIKETLDGFALQDTTFSAVFTVVDDASTDGEPAILREWAKDNLVQEEGKAFWELKEYGERVVAHHKNNTNLLFVIILLSENYYQRGLIYEKFKFISEWKDHAKYHGFCEGDDYWVTADKLQKQISFLENNPDYGMCFTGYQRFVQDKNIYLDVVCPYKQDDAFKWILLGYSLAIGTATVIIRRDLRDRIFKECKSDYDGFPMGDTQTWFHAARLSKVYYLPENTAIYRKHQGGATAYKEIERGKLFKKKGLQMRIQIAQKYGAPKATFDEIYSTYGASLIQDYISQSDYKMANKVNEVVFGNHFLLWAMIHLSGCLRINHIPHLWTTLRKIKPKKVKYNEIIENDYLI